MDVREQAVDLTASSAEKSPPQPPKPGPSKRKRDMDNAGEEDAARSRIMAFAKHTSSPMKPFVPTASEQSTAGTSTPPGGVLNAANRNRIMEHAQQVNAQKNNALLAELHAGRVARQAAQNASAQPDASATTVRNLPTPPISVLTYNVWFEEEVALEERMAAIGDVIVETGFPTVICLQEVTDSIFALLSSAPWMKQYEACPAGGQAYYTALLYRRDAVTGAQPACLHRFPGSCMGRGRQEVTLSFGDKSCRFVTSHLESPCGWNQPMAEQRLIQCKTTLAALDAAGEGNVIFAGDLNWLPADGPLPLTDGWVDAWSELHSEEAGYTYDGKQNPMLTTKHRTRLDRVLAKLADWKPGSIEIVGTEAIPGVTRTVKIRGMPKELPVLPSDHFGLFFTMQPC